MQTLGLSPGTPKPEGRLKTLFWPSVRSESDVEVIAYQGFWVCFVVALFTFCIYALAGAFQAAFISGLFFFLGGMGVRQHSRLAALSVFALYAISTIPVLPFLISASGVGRVLFLALLLANVRATFISAKHAGTPVSAAPRIETFGDKLADRLPARLWPATRWVFYALAVIELPFAVWLVVKWAQHR